MRKGTKRKISFALEALVTFIMGAVLVFGILWGFEQEMKLNNELVEEWRNN